jgi:serine/threonine-protein kinase
MAEVTEILCPSCHKPNVRRAKFCAYCRADMVLNNDAPTDDRRYVITRVIKAGGQGAVYEGIDEGGKVYAIKEMLDKFTDQGERSEAIERFNDEAEMLQGMTHPRIPRVYSHFTDNHAAFNRPEDEKRHYLTMDFIRGEDLEQIVEREGRIDERRVLEWADQICDVLDYLHSKGLVYRDMKPSNVMIERDGGGVKLVDFGIAKLFKPTERGTQIGTPGYAPPEQYQGLATPQSDLYALGATLHHLLTGLDPTERKPFDFPPVRNVAPGVSQRTSDAIARAVQFKIDDRYGDIREFWDALIPWRNPRPAQVRVAPATRRIEQPAAAQVGAPPVTVGTPARSPQPLPAQSPRPQQVAPVQPVARPARPAPPQVQPRRRGFFATLWGLVVGLLRTLFTLAVVGALGLGVFVYFQRPAWAEPYVAPLLELIPAGSPGGPTPSRPVTSRMVSYDLEVTLPEGSNDAAVRQAFLIQFAERAREEFGESTQVNMNTPPTYVGGQPLVVAERNGQVTYSVRMQGSVFDS